MPWLSLGKHRIYPVYKDYDELSNAELKERLIRRGLRHTGTKAVMAARLTENDDTQ